MFGLWKYQPTITLLRNYRIINFTENEKNLPSSTITLFSKEPASIGSKEFRVEINDSFKESIEHASAWCKYLCWNF